MKRTDKQNPARRIAGAKAEKAPPAKTSKREISAASKKTSAAETANKSLKAEKTLKNIKAKSSAKVSAPLPKAKKSLSAKTAAPAKPTAPKKETVAVKAKTVKKSKPVTAVKDSGAVSKTPKTLVISDVKPGKKKIAQPLSDKTPKLKTAQISPKDAGKKTKTAEKKVKIEVSPVSVKNKKNSPAANNKTAAANKTAAPIAAATVPKLKASAAKIDKKAKVVAAAKDQKLKTKPAAAKTSSIAAPPVNQKAKAGKTARKIEILAPITKPQSKKKVEIIKKKTAKTPLKKVEKKIEIVVPPITVKPVKKKLKPIGSAVVRGKSGRYDFEVFPLDADLKDGSAIYVISKRITDKSGRGHHKFVCIGQTESLLGEIKRHKKDKCIKQHKANVICLLREESAANRLKIETDLREAHSIACNQK